MNITVAKTAGFCPGVRRAVEAVMSMAEKSGGRHRIYTLGQLIHNNDLTSRLAALGVGIVTYEQLEELASGSGAGDEVTVVIRTHGVTLEEEEMLRKLGEKYNCFHTLDMTCPFVKKIQNIAQNETDDNSLFIMFGDSNHPEVRGIVSRAHGSVICIPDSAQLFAYDRDYLTSKPIVMASQTTQSINEWNICQKYIKNLSTNAKIFDTICIVTEDRQTETAMIASKADVMIVVGGKNSSNTRKLFEVSSALCRKSFLVENSSELPSAVAACKSGGVINLGITAGASTPGGVIQEVKSIMSEIETNEATENNEVTESFEQMLDESMKTLYTGDIVKGIVTSVSPNELHVDLSAKVTGIVPFDEITDDSSAKLADLFHVGDEIEAQAFRVSDVDGVATLSIKRVAKLQGWREIVAALNSGVILSGKVTEVVKGGAIVSYKHAKIFVPERQSGVANGGDLNTLKGQTVNFKVIEINEERNRAVGSIRAADRELRHAKLDEFWNTIEVGKKYTGPVRSIMPFGVFVDLGGIDGMVHSSELSWTHIKNPSEVVSIGQVIEVFVLGFDREAKRISLGYKSAENNPFNIFLSKYKKDDVVPVRIVSMTEFGAFAEIIPGVDGLIHISQISDKRIEQPSSVLSIGQTVDVKIIGIEEESHRVSLSIRALLNGNDASSEESAPVEE